MEGILNMRKSLILFFISSFFTLFGFSQKPLEFEGVISFSHTVIPKEKDYDVNYDYSGIGKTSDFYYKNGNYKWLTYNSYFIMDLFISKDKKNYLLTTSSDSMYWLNSSITDIEVLDYSITKNVDTILGYICNVLTIKLKPESKSEPISYRRYYFSNKFYVNPEHFKDCKGNCYELIYSQIKSIPLRIEFEWPNRIVIWEAVNVESKTIDESFFKLDKDRVLLKM